LSKKGDISIRRSILANMLMVVALFAIAVLATTVIGAGQMAETLSRTLIGQTLSRTEGRVRGFISPVENALNLVSAWTSQRRFDVDTGAGAEELLLPILSEFGQLYGAMVIAPDGRGMTLSRFDGSWRLSLVDGDPNTHQVPARTLPGDENTWETTDYDLVPTQRPWYQGAVETELGVTYWTEAYKFFLSERPGITASRRIRLDGQDWVIALDVLLEDISDFTRHFKVGYQGLLLITDGNGQVIGLPNLPRFASATARNDAYLKRPDELGFKLAVDATAAFQPDFTGPVATDPVRFRSDGRNWWGLGNWIDLSNSRQIWAAVVVPETELLGNLNQLRILIVTVTFLVTALAITRAIVLARRYSQPIRALAIQSLRYSAGNLKATDPIDSMLSEVRRLAEAHESMRLGLVNMFKLEDDLKLAREIQQKTFPDRFPVSPGLDITAGSRPAEATGGDTYDVIGVKGRDGSVTLAENHPESIFLMLSDATGHGVGPALTASQVRAMFRMGVRLGNAVPEIACEMNAQLRADAHEGRFVTAFLAEVDTASGQVRLLSAGQAPILIFRAANDQFEQLSADGPPMGVIDSPVEPARPQLIELAAGDILTVLSDGVFDAKSFDEQRFGQVRIEQIIRVNRDRPVREILTVIKDEIDHFMAGRPADDDQTGILVKRL
jgi:serine phosphatase RsbU (regulator of sigma subunit)